MATGIRKLYEIHHDPERDSGPKLIRQTLLLKMLTEVCKRDYICFRFPVPPNPLDEHLAKVEPN